MQGIVIYYNNEKGYGFIKTERYEENIFIHYSDISNAKKLSKGQEVEFEIKKTKKGLSAISLVAGAKQHSPYLIFALLSIFFIGLISTFLFYQEIKIFFAYLIAINIITFILYGYDKAISGGEKLRVPEYNLHTLALLGGSPSALLAQKFFRHKTIKSSFQIFYWIIVILQISLIIWLLNEY